MQQVKILSGIIAVIALVSGLMFSALYISGAKKVKVDE